MEFTGWHIFRDWALVGPDASSGKSGYFFFIFKKSRFQILFFKIKRLHIQGSVFFLV
jgi:hypothetical protein